MNHQSTHRVEATTDEPMSGGCEQVKVQWKGAPILKEGSSHIEGREVEEEECSKQGGDQETVLSCMPGREGKEGTQMGQRQKSNRKNVASQTAVEGGGS